MLTRLEVNGFKNLVDFALDFGPFTCIFGPNGAGKSNRRPTMFWRDRPTGCFGTIRDATAGRANRLSQRSVGNCVVLAVRQPPTA